jgi:addiction module HigA family antidote
VSDAPHRKERSPAHPGAFLRDVVMPAVGLSRAEFAKALRLPPAKLVKLLDENARITPAMALRLGKLCGDGPEIWLAMQAKRDLWDARESVDVSAIPTLPALVQSSAACAADEQK